MKGVYSDDRTRLYHFNYSKGVFFDERKKRFVDFHDMDHLTYRSYYSPFTNYRPDYFGNRAVLNDQTKYLLATMLVEQMYKQRKHELTRMYILFRRNFLTYIQPLYDYHIKLGSLDRRSREKYLKWDDASLTVGYYDYVIDRISKYGLHFGALTLTKFPNYKEEIQQEEDRLVDYFLYEMKKPPAEEKEIQQMPLN